MDNLPSVGSTVDKIIGAVERAFGAVYRPYGMKREADAEAYRLTTIESAKTQAEAHRNLERVRAKVEADLIREEGKFNLESRLQARLQHEALMQQQNIERIVVGALDGPEENVGDEEIDPDWLGEFFERSKTVSRPEMQALWSKVLALEAGAPGRFSRRSLDILRGMSHREAMQFRFVCRLAVGYGDNGVRRSIIDGARYDHWIWESSAPEIDLARFGLPFLAIKSMMRIGLVHDEHVSSQESARGEELLVRFSTTSLRLRAKRRGVCIRSYALTDVGRELSLLVTPEEDSDYIAALSASLSKFFFVLEEQ